MIWQPIDFQKIASLDQSLVEQLNEYLTDKESVLAKEILSTLSSKKGGKETTQQVTPLRLSEAAEQFSSKLKKMEKNPKSMLTREKLLAIVQELDSDFWGYVEVLEGCVKELFQQIEQVEFSHWGQKVAKVLDDLKEMIEHHIEDVAWTIRKLQLVIEEVRRGLDKKESLWVLISRSLAWWIPLIDTSLIQTLQKSEKYLRLHHKKYAQIFAEYISLDVKVKQIMKKFHGYEILRSLDEQFQEQYHYLYYIIKLWQHNQKGNLIPVHELVRSLLHKVDIESSIALFEKYRDAIKSALFHQGRLLKRNVPRLKETGTQKKIDLLMRGYHAEILSLGSTINRYRDLLLRTDPNPYVRSRWGFTEGVVGPEPVQTKKLQKLGYELEYLEELLESLRNSIQKAEGKPQKKLRARLDPSVAKVIHEMSQPLTAYSMAKKRAEWLVEYLADLDELGSTDPQVVSYAGQIFSKALRADWKYHVLHEIPKFHELFKIHVGILGSIDDKKHQARTRKFTQVIKDIEAWVTMRETRKHAKEIEYDINDLKGYLQDFLAQVQRLDKELPQEEKAADQLIEEMSVQLMLYRYLFAEFFHKLDTTSNEGKRLRNKFLFVDQYFESVEQRLHSMKNADEDI
jgi:hypothetical protein